MPHLDPAEALRFVLAKFPEIPFWPQFPRLDFRENMYAQFSENLPTVQIDLGHEWIGATVDDGLIGQAEGFYSKYLADDPNLFAISPEYARGPYLLKQEPDALRKACWIKGQVTGPISFGLKVTDQNLRPILYDDTLHDVLVKYIARKAKWSEQFFAGFGQTLTFVDEPSLVLIGASMVALNRDQVVKDLEEIYSSLSGLKGTHCCGNTDWSLLLQTSVDVISFDAYNYTENLALFATEVKAFLERGGALAWGIVPTVEEQIAVETPEHLTALLDSGIELLVRKGVDRDLLYEQALITPSCGLGTVSVQAAERALSLASQVSKRVRRARAFSTD